MKTFKKFITEATISGPIKKSIEKDFAKAIKAKLHPYPETYVFSTGGKNKFGLRYFIGDTINSIRFNWIKGSKEMESIDIWNGESDVPNINIDLKGIDFLSVSSKIKDLIKAPRVGMFDVELSERYVGRPPKHDTLKFVARAGLTYPDYRDNRSKYATGKKKFLKTGTVVPLVVKKGKPEVHDDKNVSKNQRILNKEYDPGYLFLDLRELVNSVIVGSVASLVITGSPGSGKSTVVEKELNASGKQWIKISGSTAPFGLYEKIYRNRKKLIVFDDSDSVFGDRDSVNILKAALDSNKVRNVAWVSKNTYELDQDADYINQQIQKGKIPNTFVFEGRIIFVSNLSPNKIDPAILDRSLTINVEPKQDDMIKRIKSIMSEVLPEVKLEIKWQVMNFLEGHLKAIPDKINMRSFVKAVNLRLSGSPRWEHLILKYL